MRSRVLVLVVVALPLAACLSTSFIATDASFQQGPIRSRPEVFLDKLPARPYRAVGIIQVRGEFDLEDVIATARAKATEIGCEVLIERSIHRVSAADVVRTYVVATVLPQLIFIPTAPPGQREFVCGVFLQPVPPKPANAAQPGKAGSEV